ncbi:MAG: peptidylprolyl isomerase [Bacteroidales bacterium]|nr:peptidylprolyl isomerase [Bacteroidales bacterium]
MRHIIRLSIITLISILFAQNASSQDTTKNANNIVQSKEAIPTTPISTDTIILDRVVAVVGNKIILESQVEAQLQQAQARNLKVTKGKVFEDLLYQNLLIAQAEIDSIDVQVTDKMVEEQVTEKLNSFIDEMGGVEKMEEYFNKSLAEIKEDLRDATRDQLIARQEQNEITKDVKITPAEVNKFYKNLSKDSLPLIDLEFELNEIDFHPIISKADKEEVKKQLLKIKKEVETEGASFETKAILYSDDPGSSAQGGELGMMSRGELVPEFSAAAFQLKKDSISDVIETEFGFHIIQLIDRKGERINVRHILLKPKFSQEARIKAKNLADSVYNAIINKNIKFEDAAKLYSTNENTGKNGGVRVNPYTSSTKFTVEILQRISPPDYYYFKNLKEGEITKPFESYDEKGNYTYKIIEIKSRVEPHIATIETDYQVIQDMALSQKNNNQYDKWINEKSKSVYVKISKEYQNLDFKYTGWLHQDIER